MITTAITACLLATTSPAPEHTARQAWEATVAQKGRNAPLPAGKTIGWSHAPYEMGQCGICHQSNDSRQPGAVKQKGNALCFNCHEQLKELMARRKHAHPPADEDCLTCHNPHNSAQRMLLNRPVEKLCGACHADIKKKAEKSDVKHGAVTDGKACVNCHNPHASDTEKLLISMTFDLCVQCHNKEVDSDDGRRLTNFKALLEKNPVHHGPVAGKDCSACHDPHGSENTRLLVQAYPPEFYSPYDPKLYAMCYRCHNEQILAQPRTTALTGFRDGDLNLHYLHVNKIDRGRTCRACHEVHASRQPHQIRDGVPYGSSGWVLQINYQQTPTGGSCAKTCHSTRSYNNTKGQAQVKRQ